MFAVLEGTIDPALERDRESRRCELRAICEQQARLAQRLTEIVRAAGDAGDWQAAGHSTSAAWLAEIASSDYRTAARITRTSDALRKLPALDEAMSTGALTLDQVAAAAEFATPASDAELARVAVGKAPKEIALVARTIVPPKVEDDKALYERRALSMTWTRGKRELVLHGRLPLEQGVAFEQAIWSVAKEQRAADKQAGVVLEWQQSAADALVTLARRDGSGAGDVRRSPTTLIVHLSEDAPPLIEGAGPVSIETAERLTCDARRLTIKPAGARPRALSRRTLRVLPTAARTAQALGPLPVPRLHRHTRTRSPPPHRSRARRQDRARQSHPPLPAPPQAAPRSLHPHDRKRRQAHFQRQFWAGDHHWPATRATRIAGRNAAPRLLRPKASEQSLAEHHIVWQLLQLVRVRGDALLSKDIRKVGPMAGLDLLPRVAIVWLIGADDRACRVLDLLDRRDCPDVGDFLLAVRRHCEP